MAHIEAQDRASGDSITRTRQGIELSHRCHQSINAAGIFLHGDNKAGSSHQRIPTHGHGDGACVSGFTYKFDFQTVLPGNPKDNPYR